MTADALATLHLCHNHHRTGAPTGLLRQLSLTDPERLTLESPWIDRFIRCEVGPTSFRLGKGREWVHHGHTTWVGNWCWDVVAVNPGCLLDVVRFALAKGYRPTVGTAHVWDKIDRGEELTAFDLL